jgi:hypothetical protein
MIQASIWISPLSGSWALSRSWSASGWIWEGKASVWKGGADLNQGPEPYITSINPKPKTLRAPLLFLQYHAGFGTPPTFWKQILVLYIVTILQIENAKMLTSGKNHSSTGSKMDLPVLQIETNLDMQLEHVNITCIYIYTRFPVIFRICIPQKHQIEITVKKLLKISRRNIYIRNLDIFIKRIRNN